MELDAWTELARRDDCFERLVPSDLRELIGKALRYEDALRAIRRDMTHPRNSEAIVCTVWHSDIETVVDFITNTLGDENQPGDD